MLQTNISITSTDMGPLLSVHDNFSDSVKMKLCWQHQRK